MRYIYSIIILILIIYIIINKNHKLKLIHASKNKLYNFISTKINNNNTTNNYNLILLPHLELGDNIIINGAVRHYCTIYKNVILICKINYKTQIEYMYSDLNNLLLYPINGGVMEGIDIRDEFYYDNEIYQLFNQYNIDFIPMCGYRGAYSDYYTQDATKYPVYFFEYLNLPYEIRYTKFKINRDENSENILYNNLVNIIGDKYIVVIDDEKRNYVIDKHINSASPIFKLGNNSNNKNKKLEIIKSDNIFNYIKILENAEEIHTIDSSIVLLIDALDLQVKTHIHRYIRPQAVKYKNTNFSYIM